MKRMAGDCDLSGVSLSTGTDVADYSSLARVTGDLDIIINAAASFGGDDIESMTLNETVNSVGTLNVCRLAAERGASRIILISSIYAVDSPYNERFNSYALSKRHSEENIRQFSRVSGINFTILRFAATYDIDREAEGNQAFFYYLIDKINNNEPVDLFGSRDVNCNFISITDVAEVIARAASGEHFGIYNCINPVTYKVTELVSLIAKALGKEARIKWIADKADIKDTYLPEGGDIYAEIAFEPCQSLIESIRQIAGVQ